MTADEIRRLARECGFELAGIARAEPLADDNRRYLDWVARGMAGAMGYLTDRRAHIRTDPRLLLSTARSIICVGKLYNSDKPRRGGSWFYLALRLGLGLPRCRPSRLSKI